MGYVPSEPNKHRPPRHREARPARGKRLYDDRRWRTLSKAFLHRFPMCRQCALMDVHTPAQCVDHIVPHKGSEALFWLESNWQPLCYECHGVKTAMETLGVAAVPTIQAPTGREVVLLCGPPGSGRLAYAHKNMSSADEIVDQAGIAAQIAGCPRHAAPHSVFKSSLAERNQRLRKSVAPCLWVIVDAPTYDDRRALATELKAARVVVFQTDAEECAAAVDPQAREPVLKVARAWWRRYTRGRNEETIGY